MMKAARHFYAAAEVEHSARLAADEAWLLINQGQARALGQLLEQLAAQRLEVELQAKVYVACGQVHAFLGERDLAEEGYKGALSHLEALPTLPAVRELKARACRGMARLLANEAPDDALAWLQRALDELAGVSALEEAKVFTGMGSVLILQNKYGEAVEALEEGLRLLPEGFEDLRARLLGNLGVAWCSQGNLQRGGESFQRALEIFRRSQNRWGEVGALHNLGMIKEYTGDWGGSANMYEEALGVAEQLGDVERQVELESSLGILQMKRGEYDNSLVHLSGFLELAGSHLRQQMIYAYASLADLQIRRGELEKAEAALGEAERLALELPARSRLPEIYRLRGEMHLAEGEVEAALDLAGRGVNEAREIEGLDPLEEGTSLRVLGQALLADGQSKPAEEAFEQSLTLLKGRDDYEAARTKAQWGRALLSGGDLEGGAKLLQEARAKFDELGAKHDLVDLKGLLESG
jgi:tetratricopeptide (TPR) repeat protein